MNLLLSNFSTITLLKAHCKIPWLFFAFFLFAPLLLNCQEPHKIPSIFHWIHPEISPISEEEVQSIQSWQKIHPKWGFKLWTNAPCSLRGVEICKINSFDRDFRSLKKEILQREGGVFADLRLIGCKTLQPLINSGEPFQTADGSSLIGCAPTQYDSPRKILPDSFILPDQIFAPQISSLPLDGACFWNFTTLPTLTEQFLEIQLAKSKSETQIDLLLKKLSRMKSIFLTIILFCCLNTFVFIRWFHFFAPFFSLKGIRNGLIGLVVISAAVFSFKMSAYFFEARQKNSLLNAKDFSSLFNLHCYSAKLTDSDLKYLAIYNTLFAQHCVPLHSDAKKEGIPHIIHFIWGGGPFPETSIANLASWMKLHPEWTFNFWTDDPSRPVPLENMKKRLFDEILSSSQILPYFEKSQNWGEKSDLLRYEILYREGGIYIDHDVECLRSFASLHKSTDFYASAEPLHLSPIYNSHLTVTNCLIGTKPNHPILSQALALSLERWDKGSQIFPSNDQRSTLLRTLYRTFSPFDEAVRSQITHSTRSLILPPPLLFPENFPKAFSKTLENTEYPLASHQWANTWFRDIPNLASPAIHEQLIHKILALSKFCFRIALLLIALFLLSSSFIFFKLKKRSACSKKSSLPSLL